MEEPPNANVESRREHMISPSGVDLSFRAAHFLTPSITSHDDLSPPSFPPLPPTFDPKKWPLTVNFSAWRHPQREWNTWVEKMASLHGSTWRKAGIYEAILSSTYVVNKSIELVFGIVERWCPETNSFIFPWGEATITLEDVMVLSGYSALGYPVFSPLDLEELVEVEEKLVEARREIVRTSAKKASQNHWSRKFKDGGSEIEHEAFLALWLSRFVLVTQFNVVSEHAFPIAIRLARGIRIALAPAVLACIYRDLSFLKQKIVALAELEVDDERSYECDNVLDVTLWSPFHLVQLWVWERFSDLQPIPKLIKNGEPRLAQWDNVKFQVRDEDVRLIIDSAEESFIWRPYTKALRNWCFPEYYPEREMWVSVGSDSDQEMLSFIRFMRPSELVGLDCIEQYLPHRVALQFGIDQDLPGPVPRCNESPEIAWSYYDYSIHELFCYVPSREFQADVTERYFKWWQHEVVVLHNKNKSILHQRKALASCRIPMKSSKDKNKVEIRGAKCGSSFKMTCGSPSERKAVRIVKQLKMPCSYNLKGKTKGVTSTSFKTTPKNFNRTKNGKASFSSFKMSAKSLKASTSVRKSNMEGKCLSTPFGFLKKSPKEMAGSSGLDKMHNNAKMSQSSLPMILKRSCSNSKGKGTLVSDKYTSCKSSPSLKRKNGENYSCASTANPLKKYLNDNNSPVPPGFPPKNPVECNQIEERESSEEDQMTIAEVLRSSIKQHDVNNRWDKDVDYVSSPSPFQRSFADSIAGEVVERSTTSVENKENESVRLREDTSGDGFCGNPQNPASSIGYVAAPKRSDPATSRMVNSGEAVGLRQSESHSVSSMDNGGFQKLEAVKVSVGNVGRDEAVMNGSEQVVADANQQNGGSPVKRTIKVEDNTCNHDTTIKIPGLKLETRMDRLAEGIAKLKAAIFRENCELGS